MFADALTRVCSAQAITADAVSVSSYDTGNITPKRKIATGEALALVVCITAIGTNTGSAKLQAIQSAAVGLDSGTQIIGEIDLATADIAAGKAYVIGLSQGIPGLRYVGANFDITGTVDFTVDAYIMPRDMASIAAESYAKNYVT